MNNFLEFINKDIEGKKSQLSTLPTRTKTNIKKYNEALDEMISKYEEYEKNVYTYIKVKAKNLIEYEDNIDFSKEKQIVEDLERVKFILNPLNTFVEKIGFDTMLYQINNYYTLNFKSLNLIINGLLDKFELAGIRLTADDFDYTCYVHEYMTSFLEVRDNKSKNYSKVSEIFEQIYWLNPDLISHIELNFRKLIRKNSKKLNEYVLSLQRQEMSRSNIKNYDDCLEKLKSAYIDLNLKRVETIKDIVELSKNGVIDIEHYMDENKIRKQAFQSVIEESVNLDNKEKMTNICNALEKLKCNIDELSGYLEFKKLFDNFKDKYNKKLSKVEDKKTDKKPEKKISENGLKEIELKIDKEEQELEKLNKKINGTMPNLFFLKKEENTKEMKVESLLKAKELYELYKKYDEEYFNDKVKKILNNTISISDVLNLYCSFDYFKKKELQNVYKLTDYEEIIKYSDSLDLFNMSSTNIIIEGLPLFGDTDLSKIICNKYRLSSIHIEEEDLTEDNLKALLNKINIILRVNKINNSNTTIDKILFVSKAHKYELKKQKTNEKH